MAPVLLPDARNSSAPHQRNFYKLRSSEAQGGQGNVWDRLAQLSLLTLEMLIHFVPDEDSECDDCGTQRTIMNVLLNRSDRFVKL